MTLGGQGLEDTSDPDGYPQQSPSPSPAEMAGQAANDPPAQLPANFVAVGVLHAQDGRARIVAVDREDQLPVAVEVVLAGRVQDALEVPPDRRRMDAKRGGKDGGKAPREQPGRGVLMKPFVYRRPPLPGPALPLGVVAAPACGPLVDRRFGRPATPFVSIHLAHLYRCFSGGSLVGRVLYQSPGFPTVGQAFAVAGFMGLQIVHRCTVLSRLSCPSGPNAAFASIARFRINMAAAEPDRALQGRRRTLPEPGTKIESFEKPAMVVGTRSNGKSRLIPDRQQWWRPGQTAPREGRWYARAI